VATIEYWIQLENKPWDAAPPKPGQTVARDRLTGQTIEDRYGYSHRS
jgi:hypothetical protein